MSLVGILTSITNMCIVVFMPTRNVYVSEDDVSLFAEAGEIAGSLSSAIVEALRDYVKKRGHSAEGYQEIELKLSTGDVDRRVTFVGRRLVRLTRPDPEGTRIDTVYLTAKGQLAVATKVQRRLPDWTAGQDDLWSNPETWSRNFWIAGNRTLSVFPDIDHLQKEDPVMAEQARAALATPALEVLDI